MISDATIIGAGPAGCAAAILLARAGWKVTLVEQHRFPRDKVCGECLSALGIDVLDRLGLKSEIATLHPVQLTRAALISPDGHAATLALPRAMWGVSRMALDASLLEAVCRAGVTIMQPARCEQVNGAIRIRDLVTNEISDMQSRYTLVADGKAASKTTEDLGLKAHFRKVASANDSISLFGVTGHYVGLAPIEGDRWNVAMSVPAARVKAFGGDAAALFDQCLRENIALARSFARAERVSDWLASPLPRFGVKASWQPRIIPLGNAAAALEPIGGEGMGLALRSAELAAAALVSSRQDLIDQLPYEFERLWRRRSFVSRMGAIALSKPRLARVMTRIVRPFARTALSLVGK